MLTDTPKSALLCRGMVRESTQTTISDAGVTVGMVEVANHAD